VLRSGGSGTSVFWLCGKALQKLMGAKVDATLHEGKEVLTSAVSR